VFLNRTVQGLEKRKRLEEAQPRQDHSSSSASPPSDTNSQTATPITENTKRGGEIGNSAYPVVRRLSTAKVVKTKLQGVFLEAYLPANPSDGPGVYRDWLCEVVSLNNPGKVLEYSLHALCITQAGRVGGNKALAVQGNMTYGFALKELQKALLSPRQAGKDETLAACYILSIYEVGSGTKLW
jgi:hypothetical protein